LAENHWKTNGLSKRTTMEKIKNRKTGISEALREYAPLPHGAVFDRLADKKTVLKKIKDALDKCRRTSTGNQALLGHLTIMDTALAGEIRTINDALTAATVDNILQDAGKARAFLAYCDLVEHNPEPFEFLMRFQRGDSKDALFRDCIPEGAPKQLNLSDNAGKVVIEALTQNHSDATAWGACRLLIIAEIGKNELPRFKKKYKIT
jgi:hypothetical protein